MRMKKKFLLGVVLALLLLPGFALAQPMQQGPEGPYGPGPNYCPYCGRYLGGGQGYGGMGPGMMRGRGGMAGPGYGYGMGPGMMGPGQGYRMERGMGPGYGYGGGQPYGPGYPGEQEPLEKSEAQHLLERQLRYSRNPNLKVGDVKEMEGGFEAEIRTKDDSLVDKVFIDKNTGWIRSMY